jgi:hypothetical protein
VSRSALPLTAEPTAESVELSPLSAVRSVTTPDTIVAR